MNTAPQLSEQEISEMVDAVFLVTVWPVGFRWFCCSALLLPDVLCCGFSLHPVQPLPDQFWALGFYISEPHELTESNSNETCSGAILPFAGTESLHVRVRTLVLRRRPSFRVFICDRSARWSLVSRGQRGCLLLYARRCSSGLGCGCIRKRSTSLM